MAGSLSNKKVAFLMANEGVEQVELTEPWDKVRSSGGSTTLVAPEAGSVQAFNHLDKGDKFPVDVTVADADPNDYDALVLPGGVANPDNLRMHADAVAFAKAFFDAGKPVAVICHGPWTLVEADVVRGRRLASWPSLQTDLRNAGATWVNEQLVVDTEGPNTLISSRKPDDLPAFCAQIEKTFAASSA
ncbi:MAG: intracellular protease/amidase [Actinomycetia bacterium]|nr:intracellular protease/amidase [Actinomycetes bacterium]